MDAIEYIKWWSITYFSTSGGPGPYTAAKLIGKYYTMQKQRPGTGNVSRMANSILDIQEKIFFCKLILLPIKITNLTKLKAYLQIGLSLSILIVEEI